MLSVIILKVTFCFFVIISVLMLDVVMLNVVMLSVVTPCITQIQRIYLNLNFKL
jgi:hypothetical protein